MNPYLLYSIIEARLIYGDSRNAILGLETAFCIYPKCLDSEAFLDLFIRFRPIHEPRLISDFMAHAGCKVSSPDTTLLLRDTRWQGWVQDARQRNFNVAYVSVAHACLKIIHQHTGSDNKINQAQFMQLVEASLLIPLKKSIRSVDLPFPDWQACLRDLIAALEALAQALGLEIDSHWHSKVAIMAARVGDVNIVDDRIKRIAVAKTPLTPWCFDSILEALGLTKRTTELEHWWNLFIQENPHPQLRIWKVIATATALGGNTQFFFQSASIFTG